MGDTRSIITCPVCESHGEMIHGNVRASLAYSCQNCLHEWQIDPKEDPPEADPMVTESPHAVKVNSKPSQNR
jgi:hypothetical protein